MRIKFFIHWKGFLTIFTICSIVSACASSSSISNSSSILSVDEVLDSGGVKTSEYISVLGFLVYEFENHNIFISKMASDGSKFEELCLSLGSTEKNQANLKKLNRQYVVISGIFDSNFCPSDHFCPYSCSNVGVNVETVIPIEIKSTVSK